MKIIAIEEHFSTQESRAYFKPPVDDTARADNKKNSHPIIIDDLSEIEMRLADMDKAGIDMQVLSLGPGIEQYDASLGASIARSTNDKLAEVISKYPKRFAGFASIAPQDPKGAAKELERAVKKLNLKGVMIKSNIQGEYLDNKKYWIIFKTATQLGVPVYIHPKEPSPGMIKPYMDYPELAGAMWGFGAEAGLHAMRLICSGVFDKYPGLKIILGHLGEAIPFWLWRIDARSVNNKYRKKPSQYFKDHFYVTTSGMSWQPALQLVKTALSADKVLFATDYPAESAEYAVQVMNSVPFSNADKAKIYYQNAEKLLNL